MQGLFIFLGYCQKITDKFLSTHVTSDQPQKGQWCGICFCRESTMLAWGSFHYISVPSFLILPRMHESFYQNLAERILEITLATLYNRLFDCWIPYSGKKKKILLFTAYHGQVPKSSRNQSLWWWKNASTQSRNRCMLISPHWLNAN